MPSTRLIVFFQVVSFLTRIIPYSRFAMLFTNFSQMILGNLATVNGGGITLYAYNDVFMRGCVLSGEIVAFVQLTTL